MADGVYVQGGGWRGVEGGERGFKKVPAPNTAQATIKLQVLAKWREEKGRK